MEEAREIYWAQENWLPAFDFRNQKKNKSAIKIENGEKIITRRENKTMPKKVTMLPSFMVVHTNSVHRYSIEQYRSSTIKFYLCGCRRRRLLVKMWQTNKCISQNNECGVKFKICLWRRAWWRWPMLDQISCHCLCALPEGKPLTKNT